MKKYRKCATEGCNEIVERSRLGENQKARCFDCKKARLKQRVHERKH